MDEITIVKIKELRESGMSYKKIGAQVGVSKSTVMFHLNPLLLAKHNEYVQKYYQANKAKINENRREYGREYQNKYRSENKEYVKKYNQEYNKNNPGWNTKWKKEHSKKYANEVQKKFLNKIARQKKYNLENKEHLKEVAKLYKLKNKEKVRIYKIIAKHRREAVEKSLEHTFTKKEWLVCLRYFNNKCAYCGSEVSVLQQDHVIPVSKNGAYVSNNIVPVCGNCNVSKSDKLLSDWYPLQQFYNKESEEKIYKYLGNTPKHNFEAAEKWEQTQIRMSL
jgi:DNA-binding transcriptional ArsR family regulator